MKIGDLVRVNLTDTDPRGRTAGIILEFDTYQSGDPSVDAIDIVEVHWSNSGPAWIARDRIELINVVQEIDELALSLADNF
tara:strand:- start:738 stop:980 length:243 start_codon:yes stop_codon:yes gene_type:complete